MDNKKYSDNFIAPLCPTCGGDGIAWDQSQLTYMHMVNGEPIYCHTCEGHGRLQPEAEYSDNGQFLGYNYP